MKPKRGAAADYSHLYDSRRWRGTHGIRQRALVRDLYTCCRCHCVLVVGQPRHPQSATVNHVRPHKGRPELFFDLGNVESLCKTCHDGPTQRGEARGHVIGSDINGRPIDPDHPWNR